MEMQECFIFIVAPDRVRRCQQYETHLTLHVIRPVGAKMTQPDRQKDGWTERTKLIGAFRDNANRSKKCISHSFKILLLFWRNSPQLAIASSVTRFLDHT